MALWTRYMEDYNERYRELSQDIDEQRMQELYGEDWEGLFARNANGTLNDQDISRIQTLYNTEGDPDNDSVLQQLSRFSFGEYDEDGNLIVQFNYGAKKYAYRVFKYTFDNWFE